MGRLRLVGELGRGGMGVVLEADDEVRGERVALKTVERLDAAAIASLKREFRSLADLVHPRLVRLYELFSDGERWFFTMQRVTGPTFLEHVRRPRRALRPAPRCSRPSSVTPASRAS